MVRPLDLQNAVRNEFGLVPLTYVQRRGLNPRERRREQKREERRRRADQVSGLVCREFVAEGGFLTQQQAVELAVLGVPWWMWIVRPLAVAFAKRVAAWTWK